MLRRTSIEKLPTFREYNVEQLFALIDTGLKNTDQIITALATYDTQELTLMSRPCSPAKGDTLIHAAIRVGNATLLKALIARKLNVNALKAPEHDFSNMSPLALAAQEKQDVCLGLLLDVMIVDDLLLPSNQEALWTAVSGEDNHLNPDERTLNSLRLLLEAGIHPNRIPPSSKPSNKRSLLAVALMSAIMNKKYEVLELLLKHKADPNNGGIDQHGRVNPLHMALTFDNGKIDYRAVDLLLNAGADMNTCIEMALPGGNCYLPLILSASFTNEFAFDLLLTRGAKLDTLAQLPNGQRVSCLSFIDIALPFLHKYKNQIADDEQLATFTTTLNSARELFIKAGCPIFVGEKPVRNAGFFFDRSKEPTMDSLTTHIGKAFNDTFGDEEEDKDETYGCVIF